MKCRKCKNQLRPTAKFCPRCGEPVSIFDKPYAQLTVNDQLNFAGRVFVTLFKVGLFLFILTAFLIGGSCAIFYLALRLAGYS